MVTFFEVLARFVRESPILRTSTIFFPNQ